jgi:hypothetical protein
MSWLDSVVATRTGSSVRRAAAGFCALVVVVPLCGAFLRLRVGPYTVPSALLGVQLQELAARNFPFLDLPEQGDRCALDLLKFFWED